MHARAAVKFVQIANGFRSEVKVVKDDQEANGKSIMGLLTLVAAHGVTMTVVCEGDDAAAAVAGAGGAGRHGFRRRGRSVMESCRRWIGWSASAPRPASPSASRTCLGEPGRDPRTSHRRRAGRRRDRALRAGAARDRRAARPHPGADRRARGRRAPVPDPRGAPADAVRRAPGRAGAPDRSATTRPAAEWAVRKALDQIQAVFERIEDPYFRDRKSDVALVGERLLRNLVGMRRCRRPRTRPRGSIARRARAVARRRRAAGARRGGRASAPRAAGERRTPRSWRARWGCPTSSASRASATASGRG